jgi:hypothetical protein
MKVYMETVKFFYKKIVGEALTILIRNIYKKGEAQRRIFK